MSKLTNEQIDEALKDLPGWEQRGNRIEKEYTFENYMDGIQFINRIAHAAEERNHHPDLEVRWCKVKVFLTSHDTGGVTERDAGMAQTVETLLER